MVVSEKIRTFAIDKRKVLLQVTIKYRNYDYN
nr:MAG TPA: hypothetical protein [Microviridae sp.]